MGCRLWAGGNRKKWEMTRAPVGQDRSPLHTASVVLTFPWSSWKEGSLGRGVGRVWSPSLRHSGHQDLDPGLCSSPGRPVFLSQTSCLGPTPGCPSVPPVRPTAWMLGAFPAASVRRVYGESPRGFTRVGRGLRASWAAVSLPALTRPGGGCLPSQAASETLSSASASGSVEGTGAPGTRRTGATTAGLPCPCK